MWHSVLALLCGTQEEKGKSQTGTFDGTTVSVLSIKPKVPGKTNHLVVGLLAIFLIHNKFQFIIII